MFTPTSSSTGALALRWTHAPEVAALEVWILLVDPASIDPEQIDRSAFVRELIRIPLAPTAEQAIVYVPVGRTVGLALVAHDRRGDALEPLTFTATVSAREGPAATTAPRALPPLPAPDAGALSSLAHKVAQHIAAPTPRVPGPTGFGVRQRWTLTRLGLPPATTEGERPRVVIVRSTFIGEAELAAWVDLPPSDAIPIDPGADGLVDAATPDDAMAFYAVLEGPAPWRPLPLTPVPPPFDTITAPHVIGDAAARLAPRRVSAPPDGPARELVDAAVRGLV